MSNKEVDVVRGKSVVLLQIIKSVKREGSRKIPPEDVDGGAGVLGRANDMHHWGVKGEGRRNMNLNQDQGEMMDRRAPLKVVEHTDEERRPSKTSV